MFLLALPLRIPYTPLFYMIAAVFSLFEKRSAIAGTGSMVARIFTDEEPMNLALLLMMLFAGPFVKLLLYLCLLIWAFLMWCEWGQELLDSSRETGKPIYGLPAMQPVIEFGMIFRVEFALVKSHIELFLGFLSIYLLLNWQIAPIFPIFYWQYIRIKYVVSGFTKKSFILLDQRLLKRVIPAFLYNSVFTRLKDRIYYFVDFEASSEKKKKSSVEEGSSEDEAVKKEEESKKKK